MPTQPQFSPPYNHLHLGLIRLISARSVVYRTPSTHRLSVCLSVATWKKSFKVKSDSETIFIEYDILLVNNIFFLKLSNIKEFKNEFQFKMAVWLYTCVRLTYIHADIHWGCTKNVLADTVWPDIVQVRHCPVRHCPMKQCPVRHCPPWSHP
jgi:hypothetical protein